jgi:hypothetical protein
MKFNNPHPYRSWIFSQLQGGWGDLEGYFLCNSKFQKQSFQPFCFELGFLVIGNYLLFGA